MLSPVVLLVLVLLLPAVYFLTPPKAGTIPLASGRLPLIGHGLAYGTDPIAFLTRQRAQHGNIFLVDLSIIKPIFLLGPEANNLFFGATEKKGLSFYAILEFMFGKRAHDFALRENWISGTMPALRDTLGDPNRLQSWKKHCKPIAQAHFRKWALAGKPVPLFREISSLVILLLLHIFMGPEFAGQHAAELVPLVQAYEAAIQKPQTRGLPRWVSRAGRLLERVEERFEELIPRELQRRLANPEKYEDNQDWFQVLLSYAGKQYYDSPPSFENWLIRVFPLHILTMVNGGHANQTNTFTWSFVHALRSPLLETLRTEQTPDLVEATLRETGRLYSNLIMLRRVTIPHEIMGHKVPKDAFIAISPLVTSRDPTLFEDPDSFRPERWLTPAKTLDEAGIKNAQRTGSSNQFGKGQHYCLGEKLARMLIHMYWEIILGDDETGGYDVEIVGGCVEGRGIDGVGVEAAWAEENLGTPFERGGPLMVKVYERKG